MRGRVDCRGGLCEEWEGEKRKWRTRGVCTVQVPFIRRVWWSTSASHDDTDKVKSTIRVFKGCVPSGVLQAQGCGLVMNLFRKTAIAFHIVMYS